jgi:hypothetical protein
VGILKLRITGHAKPSVISTGPRQMLHSHLNQPNYNFLKALSLPFLPHNLVLFILPCVMSTHKNIFMLFTSINLLFYSRLLNNKTLNKDKLATGAARSSLRFCIKNLHTLFLVCFFKVKGVVFFMQKPCIALTATAKWWLKVLSMVNFFYAQ